MPNIGYGSNAATKHMLPNGLYKFIVSNVKDLELLMMHNTTYCAQIAHNVSAKKRTEILKRANELSIRVVNGKLEWRKWIICSAAVTKVEAEAE